MIPGVDCDFALSHPLVNGGAAVGFFLAAERGRRSFSTRRGRAGKPAELATGGTAYADFGPGPREWRLRVAFEPSGVDYRQAAAAPSTLDTLRSFYMLQGVVLTLLTPSGESCQARFLSLEEHTYPPDFVASAEITLVEAL